MLANLSGWHLLIILAVILLLFGAARLPALSRSVGQSVRILRDETRTGKDGEADAVAQAPAVAPAESQGSRT
ncbi:twin-arginine translocase TatA/TatE family subunit [Microbacterium sp. DT81.1]|uniref:twin-arginine translocase TatA/TatE family subunit n=1 Tax=Microbacterium sp. DT81.1 TaxID=3393413 RepID=UPI003CE77402